MSLRVNAMPRPEDTTARLHQPDTHYDGSPRHITVIAAEQLSVQFDSPEDALAWLAWCADHVRKALRAQRPSTCETCTGTGFRPKPIAWDQTAHLDSGTCGCHDSWDQCPCAEGGHIAGCNCCPGGTGICGPLPCPTCAVTP